MVKGWLSLETRCGYWNPREGPRWRVDQQRLVFYRPQPPNTPKPLWVNITALCSVRVVLIWQDETPENLQVPDFKALRSIQLSRPKCPNFNSLFTFRQRDPPLFFISRHSVWGWITVPNQHAKTFNCLWGPPPQFRLSSNLHIANAFPRDGPRVFPHPYLK